MSDNVMHLAGRLGEKCRHSKFIVDETLNFVECGICHKELNPMYVLKEMCQLENRARLNLKRLEEMADKTKKKLRCKCEKCGEMTRIQR